MLGLFRRRGAVRDRTDLLNLLIERRGYRRYLEIGVRDRRHNFDKIDAPEKHGVDPAPRRPVTHHVTSDDFFAQRAPTERPYDLIFIDGLHLAEQVERDVDNSLRALSPGGAVVLHDCNPLTADAQTEDYDGKKHWNGTVWKAWVKLRATRPDLAMQVIDIDEGCGIIEPGQQQTIDVPSTDFAELRYEFLSANRARVLNLVAVSELVERTRPQSP